MRDVVNLPLVHELGVNDPRRLLNDFVNPTAVSDGFASGPFHTHIQMMISTFETVKRAVKREDAPFSVIHHGSGFMLSYKLIGVDAYNKIDRREGELCLPKLQCMSFVSSSALYHGLERGKLTQSGRDRRHLFYSLH